MVLLKKNQQHKIRIILMQDWQ